MIKVILILFIIIIFTSCSDEENVVETPPTEYSGRLYLWVSTSPYEPYRTYFIDGVIYSEPEAIDNIDAGTMTISGVELNYEPSRDGYGFCRLKNFDSLNGQVPVFGAYAPWGIAGNSEYGIKGFSTMFYTPEIIEIKSPKSKDTLYRSNGIKIEWNADTVNKQDVWLLVSDEFLFETIYDEHIPDTGSYLLNPDSLEHAKQIEIELYRIRYGDYISDGKLYGFHTKSSSRINNCRILD